MYCTFIINLTVVISLAYLPCYRVNSKSIFIVVLPLSGYNDEKTVSWERGAEILPGALAATERLNNDSQLDLRVELAVADSDLMTSNGYSYSGNLLVVADSGLITSSGYSYSGNMLELIASLALHNRLADVIGIAGVLHPNLIHTLKSFQLPIASLVHFGGVLQTHGVFYMTAPTSAVTDSIASLVSRFNRNLGLIIEASHSYFSRISNELVKKANVSLCIQIDKSTKYISSLATKFSKKRVKVIFLGAHWSFSLRMLCKAHKEGLTWPKYAWILLSFQLDSIDQNFDKECDTHNVLEGVIILELARVENKLTYPSLGGNPYAFVLYDAIRAFALAVVRDNQSASQKNTVYSQHLLSGVARSKVYFYQVLNGILTPSGVYDSSLNLLTNVTLQSLSDDPRELAPLLPLPSLMILPVLCGAFNTVLLVLFFYFRNQPDVKSTSVSLSLIMFIACYIFVAFVTVLVISSYLNLDICMVGIWGVSLGVPLILSTLLVKMLIVYHIFNLHGYEKPSIFLYNCALFVYTLLIISPKVCILILWSAVDIYYQEIVPYADSYEFLVYREQCKSNHTTKWMTSLAIYDSILSMFVVIVAIKTRKIRFLRYKDTKKVNLLVFLVLFIGISTWLYWYFFTESRRYPLVSTYILYTGCITIPFICQFTLFVPKVWTPFYIKLCNWTQDIYSIIKP